MSKYYIYMDSSLAEKGYAGWAFILTNHKGRELSHYMGAVQNGSAETATVAALTQALDLAKDHKAAHTFTIYTTNPKVATALAEGNYSDITGVSNETIHQLRSLKTKCTHVDIGYREGDLEPEKLAKEMAKNAYRFSLFGALKEQGKKVTVTEMKGN